MAEEGQVQGEQPQGEQPQVEGQEQQVEATAVQQAEGEEAQAVQKTPEELEAAKRIERLEKGVSRLRAQRNEARANLRMAAERLQSLSQPAAAGGQDAPKAPPDIAKYQDFGEYMQANIAHALEQALSKQKQGSTEAERKQAEVNLAQAVNTHWADSVSAFSEEVPDFHDVVSASTVAGSNELLSMIKASEEGPYLLYHLAQNPAEVRRLNNMSGLQLAMALGAMAAPMAKNGSLAPATKSKAPTPPVTTSGTGQAESSGLSDKISPDRWKREFQKRRAAGKSW